jgi:Low affinity iron permease
VNPGESLPDLAGRNIGGEMRSTLPIGVFSSGSQEKASTFFARMANATATWSGKPAAFLTAVAVVLVWGISGPIFHYSDTWQLVINTGTTIVTFLMVFLAMKGADNKVADIEDASDKELQKAHQKFKRKAHK